MGKVEYATDLSRMRIPTIEKLVLTISCCAVNESNITGENKITLR